MEMFGEFGMLGALYFLALLSAFLYILWGALSTAEARKASLEGFLRDPVGSLILIVWVSAIVCFISMAFLPIPRAAIYYCLPVMLGMLPVHFLWEDFKLKRSRKESAKGQQ